MEKKHSGQNNKLADQISYIYSPYSLTVMIIWTMKVTDAAYETDTVDKWI